MRQKIWILTMFPEFFRPLCEVGVVGQTLRGIRGTGIHLSLETVSISRYSSKDFKGVDDSPYGGGAGMVMRADVLKEALIKGVVEAGDYGLDWRERLHIVCPGPRGPSWSDRMAREKAKIWFQSKKDLVFVCGRYEGIDERFLINYIDEYISLGEFILSGGELAVMVYLDSALRFVPGVLGNKLSHDLESYRDQLLEYPQYTRPAKFEEVEIPEVLISGHHKKVAEYRDRERLRMTQKYRPDLLEERGEE